MECEKLRITLYEQYMGFPDGTSGKEPTCLIRRHKRLGFNPWVGKMPWRRVWQPSPYSCLENPMDRGARQAIVHRVAKSRTRLKQLSMHIQAIDRLRVC